MNGRAETSAEKAQLMDRLLDVWKRNPELRLGQLLDNYFNSKGNRYDDMHDIEDYRLVTKLENFYGRLANDRRGSS